LLAGRSVQKKLRCLLLCEDAEHEWLFRPILNHLFHRVRVEPRRPNGGFTFVLARLADAAKYVRQRPQEAVGLLVVMDGDEVGFQKRLDAIHEVLREVGFDRQRLDKIAICIPCRNVETWELWLSGARDLDEQNNYKNRFHRDVRPHLRRGELTEAWLALEESLRLPALAHGREQIRHLHRQFRS